MNDVKLFDPHFNPSRIVLVGVGGTGSHLARLLARLLVHMQSARMKTPTLCLIDPDTIEAKNIGRQLYTVAEMGMNKAEATARRLSFSLGLAVEWAAEPFQSSQHIGREGYGTLLIDAVDNHLARQEMAQVDGAVILACGNHRDAGQVCVGNVSQRATLLQYLGDVERRQDKFGDKDTLRYLPTAYALFPQLLQPEVDTTIPTTSASCAEAVLNQEQDIFVNDLMATIAARYVQQLLLRQPISSFMTFANLNGMTSVKSVPISLENIRAYL